MGFLVEFIWALVLVSVPIGIFTLALVWWALKGGHIKESLDADALSLEIKALSWSNKKKKKKGKEPETGKVHPFKKKWAKFGGGFYGIVAFFTYLVVEVLDIIAIVSRFGGLFAFFKQLGVDVFVQMFIEAITNFITAMVWPLYWMKRIDTDQVWIWFLMAYAGYWAGLRLAQLLIKRRSQVVT